MYKVKTQQNSGLPAALTARLRDADGVALKTALYILSLNRATSEKEISAALGIPTETVSRALRFWVSAGLIIETDEKSESVASKTVFDEPKAVSLREPLSPERISGILLRNPQIANLMQETQTLLGRPLASNESRLLLEVIEYDGLPADTVLLLVGFCEPRAKSSRAVINNVSRLAEELSNEGVTSYEAVCERIRLFELREQREKEVADALELKDKTFSRSEKANIARWYEEYGYDISFVKEAALRAGEKNTVKYIGGILKSWYNNGYKTLKDTREEISNTSAPVSKTRARGEDSLIKRAVNMRRDKETV